MVGNGKERNRRRGIKKRCRGRTGKMELGVGGRHGTEEGLM